LIRYNGALFVVPPMRFVDIVFWYLNVDNVTLTLVRPPPVAFPAPGVVLWCCGARDNVSI